MDRLQAQETRHRIQSVFAVFTINEMAVAMRSCHVEVNHSRVPSPRFRCKGMDAAILPQFPGGLHVKDEKPCMSSSAQSRRGSNLEDKSLSEVKSTSRSMVYMSASNPQPW